MEFDSPVFVGERYPSDADPFQDQLGKDFALPGPAAAVGFQSTECTPAPFLCQPVKVKQEPVVKQEYQHCDQSLRISFPLYDFKVCQHFPAPITDVRGCRSESPTSYRQGLINYLEEMKAEVDSKDMQAWEALVLATISGGRCDIVSLDSNFISRYGHHAMVVALGFGNTEAVKFLLSQGADLNTANSRGENAVFWAAKNGMRELARLMTLRGADIHAKTVFGLCALDYCANINCTRAEMQSWQDEYFLDTLGPSVRKSHYLVHPLVALISDYLYH